MGGGIAHHPLKLLGESDERGVVWALRERLEVGVLASLRERGPQFLWYRLRKAINIAVTLPKNASDITNRRTCRHRPERDDLRDLALAILLRNVADHLFSSSIFKVNVDVRHRDAVFVQEAFKWKVIVEWVYGGDPERIGDDRAWGTPSARGSNPLLSSESNEVGNDQEVGAIPHLEDHAEFVIHSLTCCVRRAPIATCKPSLRLFAQPAVDALPLWHLNVGHAKLTEGKVEINRIADHSGVAEQLWPIREERGHLCW